ncbi:MAG: ABC transporter permease [Aestuariivita sp.]|nr:ABC transporter permease [Aestuariivita sp.]
MLEVEFPGINLSVFLATMVVAAMPVLLAAIGELVVEKSGVLNLGVEGLMIIGAVCGFIVSVETGSSIVGIFGALLAGASLAGIFGLLTQYFHASQVATGLALTLFGLGLSALLGQSYTGIRPPDFPVPDFGFLSELPVIGILFFSYDILVYFSILLVIVIWWFLKYSRTGLALRAIGENHNAAHSLGYHVTRVRLAAILFGGACGGLGGAYLALIRVPQWTEGMTAGAGWIALALVVFGSWRPFRVVFGAFLFGGITLLQLNLQALGIAINPAYLSMTPYIVTIVALVVISRMGNQTSIRAPACLGKPFDAPK